MKNMKNIIKNNGTNAVKYNNFCKFLTNIDNRFFYDEHCSVEEIIKDEINELTEKEAKKLLLEITKQKVINNRIKRNYEKSL